MLQASPREARRTDLKPDNLIDSFAPYWTVVFPIQTVRVGGGWMNLGGPPMPIMGERGSVLRC